jgi:hypothetical protein
MHISCMYKLYYILLYNNSCFKILPSVWEDSFTSLFIPALLACSLKQLAAEQYQQLLVAVQHQQLLVEVQQLHQLFPAVEQQQQPTQELHQHNRCDECFLTFTQRSSLLRHLRQRHNITRLLYFSLAHLMSQVLIVIL